jgi:hypothetical protein
VLLQSLIERYGEDALLTVRPYVLDDGEILRWTLEVDGKEVPDVDVRIRSDSQQPDWMVMLLVSESEEVEISRWARRQYRRGPAAVLRTLGSIAENPAPGL